MRTYTVSVRGTATREFKVRAETMQAAELIAMDRGFQSAERGAKGAWWINLMGAREDDISYSYYVDDAGERCYAEDPEYGEAEAESCSECGASLDKGHGWDGRCGSCADRKEASVAPDEVGKWL